jgi:hypothetical protein
MAVLLLAGEASAQSAAAAEQGTSDDAATVQARTLFNEATADAHRGDWLLALGAFERSSALHAHAVTTYNIGYCERALGRYTRARKMFERALAESAAHGAAELSDDLASSAKTYLAELERQIARARVDLSPEGAAILIDGRPLEREPTDAPRPVLWAGTRQPGAAETAPPSTFELHVDPGSHVFVVSKAGYVDDVSTRTFEAGAATNFVVALSPVAPAVGTVVLPPRRGTESLPTRARAPSQVPIYVGLGVAGAGLATGATAGIIAIRLNNKGDKSSAGTPADVSTTGFVVGGVGAAFALVYWWLSREGAAAPAVAGFAPAAASGSVGALRVTPWATLGGAGVAGTF